MKNNTLFLFSAIIICFLFNPTVNAQKNKSNSENPYIEKTKNMQLSEGFVDYFWDNKEGKIWLSLNENFIDQEFIYVNSLSAGIGSNDIGLDRGQLGDTRIVKFIKSGPKLLLIQPNYRYRAVSDNTEEKKAVAEAFAQSVIGGFTITASNNGKLLVDATDFLLRDAHGVSGRLQSSGQGSYRLSKDKSAIYTSRTKNFPKNTEFESILTFDGEPKGNYVYSVVPSPENITVRQHHSFIELPDNNYQPRVFSPSAGYNGIAYKDYATPIESSIDKRFITRHRLEKKDPDAAVSEAVEPIVYYLDRGVPEPIRSALLDGARWWNQAYEAIGYKDAFQVKVMPEGADPLDVRYNVIQWVHRSTRGWSYGASVRDPRTGEIIKGHVSLGSLRVRQDFLIAQGLVGDYGQSDANDEPMKELALARLRQLSAHEVGHTLGLAHNFSSSVNGRASVMDYPHPLIEIDDSGNISLKNAYDDKIGVWDKVAIGYGYQDFPDEANEEGLLIDIINKAHEDGLYFISDRDARPASGAHPTAHLWDNGKDAADELNRLMEIRNLALGQFSVDKIRSQEPLAQLEEVMVPMYLIHRYQIEAASKLIGGLNYSYALKGDKQIATEMVPAITQKKAILALMNTLAPEHLMIPEHILNLIPPKPIGYGRGRENFSSRTGLTFDPIAAAENVADMTLSMLLNSARAARLIEYHARFNELPGFMDLTNEIITRTVEQNLKEGLEGELQRMVNTQVIKHLIILAKNPNASSTTRAICNWQLTNLHNKFTTSKYDESDIAFAHFQFLSLMIDNYKNQMMEEFSTQPARTPDGSPIGSKENLIDIGLLCDF